VSTHATPLSELDELVLRIRTLVRATKLLREGGASAATLRAQDREIECLKSRLADMVKKDPTVTGPRRARRKLDG
jgi:hypothetical protein